MEKMVKFAKGAVIFLVNDLGLISCIIWQSISIKQSIFLIFGPTLYSIVLLLLISYLRKEKKEYSIVKVTPRNYNFSFIVVFLALTSVALLCDDSAVILGFAGFLEIQSKFMGINHLIYLLNLVLLNIIWGIFKYTIHNISEKTRWLYKFEEILIQFLDCLCEYPFDFENQKQRIMNWYMKDLKKLFSIREPIQMGGPIYQVEEGIIEILETVGRINKNPENEKMIKSFLSNTMERIRGFIQFLINDLREIMADAKI
ncbi:MAG: hypothetical protein MUO21_01145, partial [Nitrososphaeraceae archaeon]|nr:hypothetical protein [Nitrososphaeraceae archaeon]